MYVMNCNKPIRFEINNNNNLGDCFQFCLKILFLNFIKFGIQWDSHLMLLNLMISSVLRLYSINDRISTECGAVDQRRTDRRNRSTWRKPVPGPLCMSEIIHDLTWD
jgi:hypothetical protein